MVKKLDTTQRQYIDGIFTNVKTLGDNHYEGIVSTSNLDRMGERLDVKGLDTDNYMNVNPVVIFGHNYAEPEYTIGKALSLTKTKDGKLLASFELFDDIPESKAPLVKKLIKKGVLGLSIGFVPKEIDGDTYTKSEMVEFSTVPVPANAEGAITGRSLGLTKKEFSFVFKGAISTDLPIADDNVSWNSGEAIKRVKAWASNADGDIDFSKYRKAFFWVDPENADKQGGYKMPFADIIDGDLRAVWKAVAAAMGVLQGARGGVDIPDADKDAVLTQVKKYYKKFGKDIPDQKSAEDVIVSKGAIADEMSAEEDMEQKWQKMSAVCEVWYAFTDVYYDENTPSTDFNSLLSEFIFLLTTILNGTYVDSSDDTNQDDDQVGEGLVTMALRKGVDKERVKKLMTSYMTGHAAKKDMSDDQASYIMTVLEDVAKVDVIVDRLQATLSQYLGVQNPDVDAANDDSTTQGDANDDESEKKMSTGYNDGEMEATNTVKTIEMIKGIDISSLKGKNLKELAEMLKTLSVAVEQRAKEADSTQAMQAETPAIVRKRRLVLRNTRRTATQVDKVVEQVLVELKKIKI